MSEIGKKLVDTVLAVDFGALLKKAVAENLTDEKVGEIIDKAFDKAKIKAKELAKEQLAKLKT